MDDFSSVKVIFSSVSVAVITGGSDIQGMDRKSARRGFESLTEVFDFFEIYSFDWHTNPRTSQEDCQDDPAVDAAGGL